MPAFGCLRPASGAANGDPRTVTAADSSRAGHQGRRGEEQPTQWPATAELVGRSVELELIDSLLHRRDGIGPSLLLRGDAGVGKTALLDAAAAQAAASGM